MGRRDKNFKLDLDKECEWAQKWGKSFNTAQCKAVYVGNNEIAIHQSNNLAETEAERDLEVVVVKSLSLKPSILLLR